MTLEDLEKHEAVRKELEQKLLDNLKNKKSELEKLLEEVDDHWTYEDKIYRFYHHSFKVYGLQGANKKIVDSLQSLLPERQMNKWFKKIVEEGTNKTWELSHNQEWLLHTRPILEAFFHSKYFLEMSVKYSDVKTPPNPMPSGYAGLLYLFDLRY
jgi:hypothetical protein